MRYRQITTSKSDYNMRIFAYYGILYEIALNFYKPFSIKFLERIGGSDFQISLFNALPGLVTLIAILPGAFWLRRLTDKKSATRGLILTGRFFLLAMAFIPLIEAQYRAILFIGLFTVMCIPDAIYQTSYQSFIGDLFEPRDRARAIGMRNKLTVPALAIVTLICGNLLVVLPQNEDQRLVIYQIFFILAFVFGVFEFLAFKRFRLKSMVENEKVGPVAEHWPSFIKRILKDKSFRFFALCSFGFHFGWQMGWPLFNIYTIRNLGANEFWLAIISVVSAMTMFLGYGFWSRQIEKRGNNVVLPICSFGMALTPIMYALSPNLYVLLATALISGFFTSGTLSVLLSALLEVTPEKDRVMYIAVYNVLINLSLATAPLIGHYFLEAGGIFFALYMTALFRLLGSLLFFYREKLLAKTIKTLA